MFNEASGNLDLQPFARIDQIETYRPRVCRSTILPVGHLLIMENVPWWPRAQPEPNYEPISPVRTSNDGPAEADGGNAAWRPAAKLTQAKVDLLAPKLKLLTTFGSAVVSMPPCVDLGFHSPPACGVGAAS